MPGPTDRRMAFSEIQHWLQQERQYQTVKWGYGDEPPELMEGELAEDSRFWVNGVLNYTGRVRLFGLSSPQGRQALMKIISTLIHLAELAIVYHGPLPEGGHPSGEIRTAIRPY